jgi:predicted transcriptional regulator
MKIKEILQRKIAENVTDLEFLILIELADQKERTKAIIAGNISQTTKALDYSTRRMLRDGLIYATKDRLINRYKISLLGIETIKKVLTK